MEALISESFRLEHETSRAELKIDLSWWLKFVTVADFQCVAKTTEKVSIFFYDITSIEDSHVLAILNGFKTKLSSITLVRCGKELLIKFVKFISESSIVNISLGLHYLPWFDDKWAEQVAKKFRNLLIGLELISCPTTNQGLFQISKRCKEIRSLILTNCSKITDTGLAEIVRNSNFHSVFISHTNTISDKAFEILAQNSPGLTDVGICNCSKVTNNTVSSLYQTNKSIGNRKVNPGHNLLRLKLQDLYALDEGILLWISASMRMLVDLDITNCPNIDLSNAFADIRHLSSLTSLSIGPSTKHLVYGSNWSADLTAIVPTLESLSINGIPGLDDEQFANVFDTSNNNLKVLTLKNIPIGTNTIESICTAQPHLPTITLVGSPLLNDKDLRCLNSVCIKMLSLTVGACPSLTDSAFTRLGNLRKLKKFSVFNLSPQCTGAIVKYLTRAPLTHLTLDGLPFESADCFLGLNRCTLQTLQKLSLKNSVGLKPAEIREDFLHRFIRCEEIDFTNCAIPSVEELAHVQHWNPFLQYKFTTDFSGFQPSDSKEFERHWFLRRIFIRHRAARRIQKFLRAIYDRKMLIKRLRRSNWLDLKDLAILRIQSSWRQYLARQCVHKRRHAALTVRSVIRALAFKRIRKRYMRAKAYHRHKLIQVTFRAMISAKQLSDALFAQYTFEIREKQRSMILKVRFAELQRCRLIMRELMFLEAAAVVREINLVRIVLRSWKKCLLNRRDARLVHSRQICVQLPLSYWNSLRDERLVKRAQAFERKRLVAIYWNVLAEAHNERRRINLLLPIALDHAAHTFFKRMMGKIFWSWSNYRLEKEKIKRRREEATQRYLRGLQAKALQNFAIYTQRRMYLKDLSRRTCKQRPEYQKRMSMLYWTAFMQRCFHFQKITSRAKVQLRHWTLEQGFITSYHGIARQREWKRMNTKAELKRNLMFQKHAYRAWCIYRLNAKNLDKYYYHLYILKLQKKILGMLSLSIALRKETQRGLLKEVATRAGSEDKVPQFVTAIVKLQARVRGILGRTRFAEVRVQKLYSVQVLQNFFRTMLARKEFTRRLKLQLLEETIHEDFELDRMRDAEIETRFFLYQLNAIITIQRVFRGWKGRLRALEVAIIYYRDKSIEFYEMNHHMHLHHELYLRAAIAREQLRHRSAIEIQKIVRGRIARKLFVQLKLQARIKSLAIVVQCAYRRRMAKLKLEAMKRNFVNDERLRAARRQRGLVFRVLGLTKRSAQNFVAPILRDLGIDPITYNYRIGELIDETISDFYKLTGILRREKALVSEHGFNRLNLAIGRRKILANQGWKYKVHDAVKIIEPGHKFEGFTGIITRIDEGLLGIPLYEVRLDNVPRLTFVRMTADPLLAYLRFQPLTKITKVPVIHNPHTEDLKVEHDKNEIVAFSKKNMRAARTIQQGFRKFRSRSIVARKRYEHWVQCIDRQRSFLCNFTDTNALSAHGNLFADMMNLQSKKKIFFDEMRHKLQPGRLKDNVTRKSESVVIAREFDVKKRDRTKYLQKAALLQTKDTFLTGYEPLTMGRKIKLVMRAAYGMFFKRGASLQGGNGLKSTRLLSRKETLVTGLDKYRFPQFAGSPHVRYHRNSMYQGEWSGIPLFTSLVPHGEGMIIFFDGWGFAREDKVLYLTIKRCRYLNAMDLSTSDPYCDIQCNGVSLQTTVKWENLNPEFHESFEIDVTNPLAELKIIVKDKDYFGADDFMGQIRLPLRHYSDGEEHDIKMALRDEDDKLEEDYDRGEIEIRLRWAERLFEDDQKRLEIKHKMLIRIQAWARRISALVALKKLRAEYIKNYHNMRMCAIKITCICRLRLAVKEFKRLSRNLKYVSFVCFVLIRCFENGNYFCTQ